MGYMADKEGGNFRALYYKTLGLRNVEQRKALEILLKNDPIDVERLSTFSTRFSLPAAYRTHVWKVIFGILPPYHGTHKFVMQQQVEQFNDLKHALEIMKKISVDDDIPTVMAQMFLLEEGALRFVRVPKKLQRKAEIMRAVVQVFTDMFDDEIDLFWLAVRFVKCLDLLGNSLEKLSKSIQYFVLMEDTHLYKHLTTLEAFDVLPYRRWFESGFAEDIPDSRMERIWDKVVPGSSKVLVFVAVSLLIVLRHGLLMEKSAQGIFEYLHKCSATERRSSGLITSGSERVNRAVSELYCETFKPIPRDSFEIIVSQAMELWDKHGSTVLTDTPTIH